MKLALLKADGSVQFIPGKGVVWTRAKKRGELGIEIDTARGAAGFIFEHDELPLFIREAQKAWEEGKQ